MPPALNDSDSSETQCSDCPSTACWVGGDAGESFLCCLSFPSVTPQYMGAHTRIYMWVWVYITVSVSPPLACGGRLLKTHWSLPPPLLLPLDTILLLGVLLSSGGGFKLTSPSLVVVVAVSGLPRRCPFVVNQSQKASS